MKARLAATFHALLYMQSSIIQFSTFFFTDPHIKVAGRLNDVRSAKEKIMEVLDTRVSHVYCIHFHPVSDKTQFATKLSFHNKYCEITKM